MERNFVGFLHLFLHATLLLCSIHFHLPTSVHAQAYSDDYSSVRLPAKWSISDFTPILVGDSNSTSSDTPLGCYLIFQDVQGHQPSNSVLGVYFEYELVWSANRDRAVGKNATLEFTKDGDLVLRDVDGSFVWSTNTSGKSVVGMKLTGYGNLMLFDGMNRTVWQSFDHPTNVLLPGQNLTEGQRLTANASASNVSTGQMYISFTPHGLQAFVDSNPPQVYARRNDVGGWYTYGSFHFSAQYRDGSFSFDSETRNVFLRLDHDGQLRVYGYSAYSWYPFDELMFHLSKDDCDFPSECGRYGICYGQGICDCPSSSDSTYFVRANESLPALGCTPVTPLSCPTSSQHRFLTLQDVSYFSLNVNSTVDSLRFPRYTTPETCKNACLRNCSCKAAIFQYTSNASRGICYMPNEVFSFFRIVPNQTSYNSTTYLKIQVPPVSSSHPSSTSIIVGVVCVFVGVVLIGLVIRIVAYRKNRSMVQEDDEEDEENNIPEFPHMPKKFTYEYLKSVTANFSIKLGGGGFGSVFDGTLVDGVRIAVKKLESINQGKKEFVAEVNTIGSVHHLNLVKLIGFCIEKSHRLLVYEHMVNGSLDRWIFGREEGRRLDWGTRRRITDDVAKGLLYLHEGCRQKIAHLDIKPENILLDSNFNAKVSDFGLAKLIDRDQSVVQTRMRGTPGYLAPEWLTSYLITEKVDVYSFGVVIAEIVCGRRNLDYQQTLLLTLLKQSGMTGQLLDIVDGSLMENVTSDDGAVDQMERMLKLAIWCLQNDPRKRPSMSMAVHVLEGKMEIPQDLGYDFTTAVEMENIVDAKTSEPCSAFQLSGPR